MEINKDSTIEIEYPRAVLVGVCATDAEKDYDFLHSIDESVELIQACDMEVVCKLIQSLPSPHPGTYIGRGKLEELAQLVEMQEIEYVILNDNLSPAQLKNITDAVGVKVLDRTTLILEIFSKRARTREARLQVELANWQYMLPRLVGMRAALGRQGGASGSMSNKGSGEKQIELDRRHILQRITELKHELEIVEKNRNTQRKSREKGHIPNVALVGYTNAGKSTIMNRMMEMSGSEEDKKVFEKNMLFATLDTTVRRVKTEDKKDFLLSDTVGFISNLPHDLVKAFRSTLDEVKYADLLLLVVDSSDPHQQDHIRVTEDTLKELNASDIPRVYVMNKVDQIWEDETIVHMYKTGQIINGEKIYISARKNQGISELVELIKDKVYQGSEVLTIHIPYSKGSIVGELESNSRIISREYTEDGIVIIADCPEWLVGTIRSNSEIRVE